MKPLQQIFRSEIQPTFVTHASMKDIFDLAEQLIMFFCTLTFEAIVPKLLVQTYGKRLNDLKEIKPDKV